MNQNTKQVAVRQLPKIEELYSNIELASKFNDLNKILNCKPKEEWILTNKFANDTKYLPIEKVEYLLTAIYLKWRVEVKNVSVIANSVVVTVRLFVLDPITNDWDWQDGVGASPIQTKKGASATDFAQVNTSAVQMSAPAAETFAIKDAAEKFGKIFGKDLNRKDEMNYQPMHDNKFTNSVNPIPDELKMVIEFCDDIEKLNQIYSSNSEFHNNKEFMQILLKRKTEINGSNKSAAGQPD